MAAKFRTAPAGKGWHHAYIGGLLEHTLETLAIAHTVIELYPQIDTNLLVTGLLLEGHRRAVAVLAGLAWYQWTGPAEHKERVVRFSIAPQAFPAGFQISSLALAPDDRLLAYTLTGASDDRIRVYDMESGDIEYYDPDEYAFWDDIHPTTRSHSLIAAAA